MDLSRSLASPPAAHFQDELVFNENISSASASGHVQHQVQTNSVLFREIHKNAWLRRLPNVEKRNGISNKKSEKVWTVFCIHDDIHPFLEFYINQESAMEHKPQWFVCLNTILHISPTIIAHDQECEFVVTLPSDVVRLAASSWDSMMEWVDAIRSKLTEMKILSPHENVYSRMPEAKAPLLPTRDPNSPLPPPPMGPSALVPGVEPVHMDSAETIVGASETTEAASSSAAASASASSSALERRLTGAQHPNVAQVTNPTTAASSTSGDSPVTSTTANPFIGSNAQRTPSRPNVHASVESPANTRNVTVVQVTDGSTSNQHSPCDIFNFNFIRDSMPEAGATSSGLSPGRATTVVTPSTQCSRPRPTASPQPSSSAPVSPPPRLWQQISQVVSGVIGHRSEHAPVPAPAPAPAPAPSRVTVAQSVTNITIAPTATSTSTSNSAVPFASDLEPSSSSSIYEQVFPSSSADLLPEETRHRPLLPQLSSPPGGQIPVLELPRRRRRTSSGSEQVSTPRSRQQASTSQHRLVEAERRLQPAPHPFRQRRADAQMADTAEVVGPSGSRVTLREQQVLQLRREMLHAGGVRMQLRRKDCVNSMALVDAFGAVWVAGWKQRECPMLYNALHIGDQLLSVAGTAVPNAAEAQRIIRSCATSLYVELVIRRLPFGRVFAIRREVEGQVLGINLEGGSGEVRDLVPHSPVARAGLTSRAPTCDGLSLTSWVLTEVNGRPLNLFFKDGEVRDRLNAVGSDISILVQPLDLIKQIRKQLRTIRGYKDYIVQ